MPPLADNSFDEFLDDFFAECDEHLVVVRRSLLALERFADRADVDRALLDDLFRSFHSLKGLAGMVGVSEVEQLAHHMEGFLRALQRGEARLTAASLDTLNDATRVLEQVVAARRTGTPPPTGAAILERLEHLLDAPDTSSLDVPDQAPPPEAARAANQRTWQVTFVPTPQLAERNINVNSVRARLAALGDVTSATPHMQPQGGVAFVFVVTSAAPDSAFEGWEDDGLAVMPLAPPEPTPEPTAPAPATTPTAASNVVRVDLGRLDELLRLASALVTTRARLDDYAARIEPSLPVAEWRALQDINQAFERQLRELRTAVLNTRLVEIGDTWARLQFAMRDIARDLGKQITVELFGETTEIDKFVVERMFDPLLHVARNAVAHGVETPAERAKHGKPPTATIRLRATAAGDTVTLSIEDDGRGVDTERVAARARSLGLLGAHETLDDTRLLQTLCAPGFSTREQADRISGRGVGMDVVATTVRELGGTLALETAPARGSRFVIQLPLTVTIMDALVVRVAEQRFAVPLQHVREVLAFQHTQVVAMERNELLPYRGGVLPLVRLARRFKLHEPPNGSTRAFVVGHGRAVTGLVVDHILGKREIVVRPLTDPLTRVDGIAGATDLGDGRVVLILDIGALV